MLLDKANNANPKFGETLVPVHVWVMNTSHSLDIEEVKTDLSFVPKQILNKMLEAIGKIDGKESHVYVVAHDTITDDYKVYLGQAFLSNIQDKSFGFSNLIATESNGPDCIQRTKLNELHIQFRPDWNGKREDPKTHDSETYDEMMQWLSANNLKQIFMQIFPNTDSLATTDPALTPSPITKKQIKPPKMTKKRRDALVKRFGEENIKNLEERIKNKKKDDPNKKG